MGEVKQLIQNFLFHRVLDEVKVLIQNFLFHHEDINPEFFVSLLYISVAIKNNISSMCLVFFFNF